MFRSLRESNLNNLNYSIEKNASEYQVHGLRTQILDLENRVTNLSSENDKLSLDLRDRYNDIQIWRDRYDALERNSNAAVQELADKLERQKRQEVEEVVSKLNTRFSIEITSLENQNRLLETRIVDYESKMTAVNEEIKRVTQLNIDRANEVDQWKVKCANLEKNVHNRLDELKLSIDVQTRNETDAITREFNTKILEERKNYETQVKTIKQAVIDLENKLRLAAAEAERLSTVIAERDYQIDVLKGQMISLEKLKSEETHNLIAQFEEEKRALLERELKAQNLRFSDERARYEIRMKEIGQHITDFESQMTYLSVELDRVQSLLEEKTHEAETLKRELQRVEEMKVREMQNLQQNYENLRRNALQVSDLDVRYQAEKAALETEIMQHRQKIGELEVHIRELTQDNEKAKDSYYELQKETDSLRLQVKDLTAANPRLENADELKRENEKLKNLSLEAHELKLKFDVDKQNYESQIVQLRKMVQVGKAEVENLYNLVNARRQENDHLTKQLGDSRNHIVKLETLYKELENKFMIMEKKHDHVSKESQSLAKARDALKYQVEQGNVELAHKNRELVERIREVDHLKAKYEDAIASIKLNSRI